MGQTPNSERASNFARRARKWFSRLLEFYVLAALALLAYLAYAVGFVSGPVVAAMMIGGFVGAVEILGRYRHAPLRAMLTWNGVSYIVINIGAAWAAYYLLGAYDVFKTTTVAKELTQILTAGFGSLVFMRSSLFKVRVGESDIGIGPAAILDTLLLVADRGVDRREAVARAQDVTELVARVKDPRVVAKMLTTYSLALMQNVDNTTTKDLSEAIGKIMADPEIPDPIKMDIVALRLGIVVGPDVLEAAVAALGDRLSSTSPTLPLLPTPLPAAQPGTPPAPTTTPSGSPVNPTNQDLDAAVTKKTSQQPAPSPAAPGGNQQASPDR